MAGSFRLKKYIFIFLSALLLSAVLPGCGTEEEATQEAIPHEEAAFDITTEAESETEDIRRAPEQTVRYREAEDPALDVLSHYTNIFLAININDHLNVRSEPSLEGNIIGKLTRGSGGSIIEDCGNGWYHISSGGIDGYIASEYCTNGETARKIAPFFAVRMVRVTAEKVNVRSGPGTEYEVWTQLGSSEMQALSEELDGWYKIDINDTYGYISSEYAEAGWYLTEAMPWTGLSSASPKRQKLFTYAEQFIGVPYKMGGTSLDGDGIDCSSFVQQCLKDALDIRLDRTSRQLATRGIEVTLEEAKPGDLMFYTDSYGTIDHVAFYMGDGKILHASRSFGQVAVSAYNYSSEPVLIKNVIGD
ncbi:MAG: SH3 domain-containing protein [Lachnospiraceae bacterium]|nr:SH3 domain-containing protein [Lachnospiraceae bacterium]